jgi:Ca-activated chloride channel family protein
MRLYYPIWLVVFVVVALLVLVFRARRSRGRGVEFSSLRLVDGLPITIAQRLKKLLPVLQFLALASLAVALSRPQMGKEETRLRTEGIAIEMAMDRSGSMAVLDCEVDGKPMDRLTAVKQVFRDFVRGDGRDLAGRPDDLIGLVAFGGFADSKCPLTIDHGALLEILDDLDIPFHTRDNERKWPVADRSQIQSQEDQLELATAIGEAIGAATERLAKVEAKSRVLILLSDGGETVAGRIDPEAPVPRDAAKVAASLGIKVYTIAFGSDQVQLPVALVDRFGRLAVDHVHVGQGYGIDEELMKDVAEIGNGRFFRATSTDALRGVYAEIDRLEKTETEGITFVEYRELYPYPLLLGLALMMLHLLAVTTRFRTLP